MSFYKLVGSHLHWYVELIPVPLCWESGTAGLVPRVRLEGHLREPNFEHRFDLLEVPQILLTAKEGGRNLSGDILTCLSQQKSQMFLRQSYPISGFWIIPRILCSLSMATLCWKLDKPATIKSGSMSRPTINQESDYRSGI